MNAGIMKLVAIGGFVVALAGAAFVVDRIEGKKIGETCDYQSSCSGSGECLTTDRGKYCTAACSVVSDCPSGWECGSVASETYSAKTGEKTSSTSIKVCLRP